MSDSTVGREQLIEAAMGVRLPGLDPPPLHLHRSEAEKVVDAILAVSPQPATDLVRKAAERVVEVAAKGIAEGPFPPRWVNAMADLRAALAADPEPTRDCSWHADLNARMEMREAIDQAEPPEPGVQVRFTRGELEAVYVSIEVSRLKSPRWRPEEAVSAEKKLLAALRFVEGPA